LQQHRLVDLAAAAVPLLLALKNTPHQELIFLLFPVVCTQYRYWLLVAGAVLTEITLAALAALAEHLLLTGLHCKRLAV